MLGIDPQFTSVGPLFIAGMIALTVVCAVVGYWIGGKIGQGTNSGVGGFFLVLLVTFVLAGGIFPLVVFAGIGDILFRPDEFPQDLSDDQINGMLGAVLAGVIGAGAAVVAFFIAGLVGMIRGRA